MIILAAFIFVVFQTYKLIYLPACKRRIEAESLEASLQQEIDSLALKISWLENSNNALEAEEPLAVEEAIRRELGWGQKDEYALLDNEGQYRFS